MKQKIFNIITYTFLLYSIFTAAWVSLPELQAALPWLNLPTVLVSGGATALLGTGGVTVQAFLTKARQTADIQFMGLVEHLTKTSELINKVLADNKILKNDLVKSNEFVKNVTERNNKLLTAMLNIQKDNKLVDDEARKIAEAILNEK